MSSQDKKSINQRCEYLDCVKGVAILCIAFLHFENGVIPIWLNTWIGMFMITAFYVSSGWVFGLKSKIDNTKDLFRKRLHQLGKPYFWFAILILAFDVIWTLCGFMKPEIIVRDIYKWVTLRGIGTLWFLPVLFLGEILFCFIMNSKHKYFLGVLLFSVTLITSYLYYGIWIVHYRDLTPTYQLLDSPIRPVVMSLSAWPIIWVGYMLSRKFNKYFSILNRWVLALLGSIILLISFWLVISPPFHVFYLNGFLSNILPALGFMCIFVVLGSSFIGKFFGYWGRNSLIMMCIHFSIIYEIFLIVDKLIFGHETFFGWSTIIYFAITVILMYPIVWLFNNKFKFMLGKKPLNKRDNVSNR